ncbi:hypothetical protein EV646_104145 [Kribbella antiqua]|uniref:Uncharacterized protein n=1 Tax=Kribbella antiqua TaxID=2512217 RepID=A0A4R2IVR8_9ACTN|nr:hypothetical protein [Kribbella antiqua]TCO48328.1 hypothetical protein EV646_104145 [Kribbella antiqua]
MRDIAGVLAAFGDDLDKLIADSRRFQTWLASFAPSDSTVSVRGALSTW